MPDCTRQERPTKRGNTTSLTVGMANNQRGVAELDHHKGTDRCSGDYSHWHICNYCTTAMRNPARPPKNGPPSRSILAPVPSESLCWGRLGFCHHRRPRTHRQSSHQRRSAGATPSLDITCAMPVNFLLNHIKDNGLPKPNVNPLLLA